MVCPAAAIVPGEHGNTPMATKPPKMPSFHRHAPGPQGVASAAWLVQEMRRLRPTLMRGAFRPQRAAPQPSRSAAARQGVR